MTLFGLALVEEPEVEVADGDEVLVVDARLEETSVSGSWEDELFGYLLEDTSVDVGSIKANVASLDKVSAGEIVVERVVLETDSLEEASVEVVTAL